MLDFGRFNLFYRHFEWAFIMHCLHLCVHLFRFGNSIFWIVLRAEQRYYADSYGQPCRLEECSAQCNISEG